MSKFFFQLLLSVLIGVGAAAGFRPDVRGELNKTLRQAKEFIGDTAHAALETAGDVGAQVKTAVSTSVKANTNASVEDKAQADLKMKGDVDMQVITEGSLIDNSVPEFSLDGSLNANSQTNVEANAEDLEMDLKNKTKSTLDLDLGLEQ